MLRCTRQKSTHSGPTWIAHVACQKKITLPVRIGGPNQLSMPFMADKIVDRYPVHSEIDVYYNPKRPNLAYLETDMGIGVWINILAGMFFLIAAQSL